MDEKQKGYFVSASIKSSMCVENVFLNKKNSLRATIEV